MQDRSWRQPNCIRFNSDNQACSKDNYLLRLEDWKDTKVQRQGASSESSPIVSKEGVLTTASSRNSMLMLILHSHGSEVKLLPRTAHSFEGSV